MGLDSAPQGVTIDLVSDNKKLIWYSIGTEDEPVDYPKSAA